MGASVRALIDPVTEQYLRKTARSGGRVLEIGCGAGQYRLVVNGQYVGIDISTHKEYKSGIPMTPDALADASHLPFKSDMFDLVFYVAVILYIRSPEKAIEEARRVLRPGGRILIFDYSFKTVERLRVSYLESWPGVKAYPKKCIQWIDLLKSMEKAHLAFRSLRFRPRLLDIALPRVLYYRWIDGREAPIVLSAQKPPSR